MEQELERVNEVYTFIMTFLVDKGFQLAGAVLILVLGTIVARKTSDMLQGILVRNKVDVTLSSFAGSTAKIIVIITALIISLEQIDVSVTPFIAAVGALSLGAGLALQGMLSNYGAGLSIILARPFVVGDTITVQGVSGVVREVKLAYTILGNEDEVQITIPNRHIVGEIIQNSQADTIVEGTIDVSYGSDTDKAIALIRQACTGIAGVSSARAPQVGIEAFAESGVTLGYRYWVATVKQFQIRYQVNSAVFAALKQNGIDIPFPQREVRLLQDSNPVN